MFQTKVVEKIKTYFVFSNFFFENRAVYKIMWKSAAEPGRPQMTIWRIRTAYQIPKFTHTITISNPYCVSTATVVARTSLNVTL
jgi:hypothetical protein